MYSIEKQYGFLGKSWSFWPTYNMRGTFNIVEGPWRVADEILYILLIRKGENPLEPDMGIAPEIFDTLGNVDPQYWVHNAESEIIKWVKTISSLMISITGYDNVENQLNAEIIFTPISTPNRFSLNFPYWSYQGALWNGDQQTFLDSISLNGESFRALR